MRNSYSSLYMMMNVNMNEVYFLAGGCTSRGSHITSRSTQAYGVQTCLAVILF